MGSNEPHQYQQSSVAANANANPLAPGGNPAVGEGRNEPYTGEGQGDRFAGRSSNI
jgi:hypothetical protein